jgi:hypothetical protein
MSLDGKILSEGAHVVLGEPFSCLGEPMIKPVREAQKAPEEGLCLKPISSKTRL